MMESGGRPGSCSRPRHLLLNRCRWQERKRLLHCGRAAPTFPRRPLGQPSKACCTFSLFAAHLKSCPRTLPRRGVYLSTFARYWLAILVLCHEGAHALSPDHALRKALEDYATLSGSSMMNEMISALTGKLSSLLDGEPLPGTLQRDLENWSATRNDLGIGDDAVFATFE